jgi:hypothetical protein
MGQDQSNQALKSVNAILSDYRSYTIATIFAILLGLLIWLTVAYFISDYISLNGAGLP